MEDVRAEVLEMKNGYEEDVNRNKVLRARRNGNDVTRCNNGRSMESLVGDSPPYPSPRRVGSYQV